MDLFTGAILASILVYVAVGNYAGRKTPYPDGTTHVLFEPLDFISRLVSLIPRPRVNLTRFHIP